MLNLSEDALTGEVNSVEIGTIEVVRTQNINGNFMKFQFENSVLLQSPEGDPPYSTMKLPFNR